MFEKYIKRRTDLYILSRRGVQEQEFIILVVGIGKYRAQMTVGWLKQVLKSKSCQKQKKYKKKTRIKIKTMKR